MIDRSTTLLHIAFLVSTELERASITAVLTGGSAAAYFAPQKYQSDDADFVVAFQATEGVDVPMRLLGFERNGRMFVHAQSRYTVEFPSGPLGVGSDLIRTWLHVTNGDLSLNVISRTDSVRDRLCGFYFWNELQSLETALAVARSGEIDLGAVREWSRREGALEKFGEFERALVIR